MKPHGRLYTPAKTLCNANIDITRTATRVTNIMQQETRLATQTKRGHEETKKKNRTGEEERGN